jgi:Ca2+/Na+ antiporter
MEFLTANSLLLLLLAVVLLFFIYQLYFKVEEQEETPKFIELDIDNKNTKDKTLDKEILEAVKLAVKMHREKKDG